MSVSEYLRLTDWNILQNGSGVKFNMAASVSFTWIISLGESTLVYPAGSGIAKVSVNEFKQEVVSLTNKVQSLSVALYAQKLLVN